jgi:hypothetical protein
MKATYNLKNLENKPKEVFIEDAKKCIEEKKDLIRILTNEVTGVLNKFDKKVVNKRICTALSNITLVTGYKVWASLDTDTWYKNQQYYLLTLYHNYHRDTIVIRLRIDSDNRLDYNKTIAELNDRVSQLEKSIADYEDAIENYDKYFEMCVKLNDTICDYVNNTNYIVRDNFSNINKFYL